ncbi:MAG: sugar phosphate isomerase/epimerase family protein [Chryseolinea sp.]
MNYTRRSWLKTSAMLIAFASTGIISFAESKSRIKISACDWSLGKSSDPGSFALAKQIGLQGVQLNLGNLENNLHLRKPEVLNKFLTASKNSDIAISSIAIAEMNRVPYKSDPRTDQWVSDAIDVAVACGVKVILLAFFDKGDLRNDANGVASVISKLKSVAPKAEKSGVILGIESYLSASELMHIMDSVGSPNVKVYYDFRNSADAGYDVIKELKQLGKDRICELHMKENGSLLRNGSMDWPKICDTLVSMDYVGSGWMQIEGGRPASSDTVESYKDNLAFLKQKFGYI